jgi:hypothetical protein
METELAIPTSLMSVPKKDIISLATAQLKFMNLFAIPLFRGAADIVPAMQYCVDELQLNTDLFDRWLLEEQERESPGQPVPRNESTSSPKTIAFAGPSEPATEAHPAKGVLGAVPKVVEPHLTPDTAVDQQTESSHGLYQGLNLKQHVDVRAMNGIVTSFTSPPDGSHHDPYNADAWHPPGHTRQRCSETTEGSSARYTGDWASQATSATTGKMPLSPSTQGTSMASRDSFERLNSVPATSTTASEPTIMVPEPAKSQGDLKIDSFPLGEDDSMRNGHVHGAVRKNLEPNSADCRQLKKKPSRFRINGLQSLFRKHKSSSPTM